MIFIIGGGCGLFTGTVRPSGKIRYAAIYRDLKGRQRSAGTFGTKRQADKTWQRAEAVIALGRVGDPARGRQTFRRYVEDVWLPNHEMEPTTRQGCLGQATAAPGPRDPLPMPRRIHRSARPALPISGYTTQFRQHSRPIGHPCLRRRLRVEQDPHSHRAQHLQAPPERDVACQLVLDQWRSRGSARGHR
jgi:hypothetical protein